VKALAMARKSLSFSGGRIFSCYTINQPPHKSAEHQVIERRSDNEVCDARARQFTRLIMITARKHASSTTRDRQIGITVGKDGSVHNINVIKSLGKGLDEKAVAAVQQWRFETLLKDGQPIETTAEVTINFRLY
jgi:TonB family protein